MIIIKRVKKKRLNIKRTLIFIILIYIFVSVFYSIINQPIKHIEINGNNIVSDAEILRISELKDYPSMLKYSSKKIEKNIKKLKLVNNVKVKKCLNSKVIINIDENKLLFYYKNTDKIVLSNKDIIKNEFNKIVGIPTLVNDVKSDILSNFIENFNKIDDNIIYEMNSIEYYPLVNENGDIISNDRFKILMNDGNTIIVNVKSVSVVNKYNDIFASLNGKLGTINLDSNKLNNLVFIPYEEEKIEEVE